MGVVTTQATVKRCERCRNMLALALPTGVYRATKRGYAYEAAQMTVTCECGWITVLDSGRETL